MTNAPNALIRNRYTVTADVRYAIHRNVHRCSDEVAGGAGVLQKYGGWPISHRC